MVGMTKPEWENILDIGVEIPTASFEKILEESRKPSRKIEIKVRIDRGDFEKLKNIANKSENKIDVSDFINDIVKDYLREQMFCTLRCLDSYNSGSMVRETG